MCSFSLFRDTIVKRGNDFRRSVFDVSICPNGSKWSGMDQNQNPRKIQASFKTIFALRKSKYKYKNKYKVRIQGRLSIFRAFFALNKYKYKRKQIKLFCLSKYTLWGKIQVIWKDENFNIPDGAKILLVCKWCYYRSISTKWDFYRKPILSCSSDTSAYSFTAGGEKVIKGYSFTAGGRVIVHFPPSQEFCLGDQHGGHQALGKFDGSFKLSVALMEVRLSPIWLLSYILSPPLLLPHVWWL